MTNDLKLTLVELVDRKPMIYLDDVTKIDLIGQSICAFLNSSGGTIFCKLNTTDILIDLEGAARATIHSIEPTFKEEISPFAYFTFSTEVIDDAHLIRINVPKGLDQPYVYKGAVWVLYRKNPIAADSEAIRKIVLSQSETRWEQRVSPLLNHEELDFDQIRFSISAAEEKMLYDFGANKEPIIALEKLSLHKHDGYTHACDLLYSKNPSDRHPQCRVQLLRFGTDRTDASFEDNRWFEGSLLKILDEVMEVLKANNPLRSNFSSRSVIRDDHFTYHPLALREGLINALVHRDYSRYSGGLKVSIYPTRIEIWNSGQLPNEVTPEDLLLGGLSFPTNPDIAHNFYLRGIMEKVGRGGIRISKACEEVGAPTPKWEDKKSGVTLTLFANIKTTEDLNERQINYLKSVQPNEPISVKQYLETFAPGITDRQARRDLQDLEKGGWVKQQGKARSTIYVRSYMAIRT